MLLTSVLSAGSGFGPCYTEMERLGDRIRIRSRLSELLESKSLPTKLIVFAAYESAECLTKAKKDTLKAKREYEEAKLIQEVLIEHGITTECVLDCGTDHFSELKITITEPKYDDLGNKSYTKKEININIDITDSISESPLAAKLSNLFYIDPDMCD